MGFTELASAIAISWRVRTLIFGTLAILIAANVVMIYVGIVESDSYPSWVEAATHLLGIIFPFALALVVLSLAENGDEVVQARTYRYMTRTIPRVLLAVDQAPAPLIPFRKLRRQRLTPLVDVCVQQRLGSCVGQYAIVLRDGRRLRFQLEINVRKANLVLLLAEAVGAPASPRQGPPSASDLLKRARHSLTGAEIEGYRINPEIRRVETDQGLEHGVVLIRNLDPKFLSSAYERVYFAQDLMFFLSALIAEKDGLFVTPAATDRAV